MTATQPISKSVNAVKARPCAPSLDIMENIEGVMEDKPLLPGTVFHEHWWLNAVTQGRFEEVVVKNGDAIVGRLPYLIGKKMRFTTLRMPPITHVLGPVVDAGIGKPQTQLLRRLSIVRELIDQLPRFDFFKQALGASAADGLAFQDRGFYVSPQYTFEVDCRVDLKEIWNNMHFKTRQHIRRAEEKLSVKTVDDPHEFLRFYYQNLTQRGRSSFTVLDAFPAAFAACRARDSGEVLSANWPDGKPAAMVFLIWGHGTMYYLLSTRANDAGDNGSVSLLIWAAMKNAHSRSLTFDLDGVSTSGIARFLSGFGGRLAIRTIVRRSSFTFGALQFAKRQLLGGRADDTVTFT